MAKTGVTSVNLEAARAVASDGYVHTGAGVPTFVPVGAAEKLVLEAARAYGEALRAIRAVASADARGSVGAAVVKRANDALRSLEYSTDVLLRADAAKAASE